MGQADRTGELLSTVIEIACTDPLYMWILYTRYNLYINPPSSGRQCHKYKGSVSKHVQTPKVTWGGLSCNCLSFCTQNLLRRTATRVYIIQEVNTHVHSLSTEYNV